MRGKCCSRSRRRQVHVIPLKKVRLRAQKWSSDLLKVCFLMWKMVFWNKCGESYRCSCWLIQQWSSRVEMVEDYWYQEGWLVPQVQPSIHAEQGRGGKDTSPSPPIAAINPPIEDAWADKILCTEEVRNGVSRQIGCTFLGGSVWSLWWQRQLITAGFVRFNGALDFDAVCLRRGQFHHRLVGFFRSHIRIQTAAFMSPLGSAACENGHPNNFRFIQRLWWLMTALRLWPGIKALQEVTSDASGSHFWLCDVALM